jgi:hypothetical protein
MYKVLVRLVLTCVSETWTLSKTDERLLSVFERIHGCILEQCRRMVCGGKIQP